MKAFEPMEPSVTSDLARELLALEEKANGQSPMSDDESIRWASLTADLISEVQSPWRQPGRPTPSLRVPCTLSCQMLFRGQTYECTVLDVSFSGARIAVHSTAVFFQQGDTLRLNGHAPATETTASRSLTLDARVARVDSRSDGRTIIGVELVHGSHPATREVFQTVYYPAYISFLRTLAQSS